MRCLPSGTRRDASARQEVSPCWGPGECVRGEDAQPRGSLCMPDRSGPMPSVLFGRCWAGLGWQGAPAQPGPRSWPALVAVVSWFCSWPGALGPGWPCFLEPVNPASYFACAVSGASGGVVLWAESWAEQSHSSGKFRTQTTCLRLHRPHSRTLLMGGAFNSWALEDVTATVFLCGVWKGQKSASQMSQRGLPHGLVQSDTPEVFLPAWGSVSCSLRTP